MRTCAQCGTGNDDVRSVCLVCGSTLGPPDTTPDMDPAKQTMLGIAPLAGEAAPAQAPPAASGAAPAPSLDPKQTLLGGVGPPAAPDLGATLVGRADPAAVSLPGAVPPTQPDAPASVAPNPQQTMLGIAPAPAPAPTDPNAVKTMLGIAPVVPGAAPPSGVGAPPSAAAPPSGVAPPSDVKTMLGVAMPGIAPLHPGVEKKPPTRPPVSHAAARPAGPSDEDLAVLPGRRKSRWPWAALAIMGVALLLGIGGLLFALLWTGPAPLQAKVLADAAGKESLEITCDGCADGTTVSVRDARAVVRQRKAVLQLPKPLAVGDNELTITIERGGGDREEIELVVPVEYRVRGDFEALAGDPPKLRVTVEAVEKTAVVVDGQKVDLDDSGRGHHDFDVSKDLTGPANEVVRLERKVPYTVTPAAGNAVQGEVALGLGITPLRVDAPGTGIVIDRANFMLAGRTQKGGAVTVAGRPITVDTSGRFAQLMNVSSVGETTITVRATAPNHAPRLVPVRVKRVKSLVDEATAFRKRATDSYSGIASDIDSKQGWAIVLHGTVVEARSEDHTTIVLLEARRGCTDAPCMARLVHGAKVQLKKNESITAYGRVTRAVAGLRKGKKVPEVAVDFILRGSPP